MRRLTLGLAMTALVGPHAPVGAQEAEPAGAPGSWSWREVAGHPGRRFRLFVPPTAGAAAPLVVMLHGCTQDPDDLARGTRFNAAAAERGVVVAYPEQPAERHPQRCWSWYDPAHQQVGGEPGLVAAVARQVMALRSIDPARVYVAGISAGGSMALSAAAAAPELFAAVGVHSGIAFRAAQGVPAALALMRGAGVPATRLAEAVRHLARPPAVIAIQGDADAVVAAGNLDAIHAQWTAAHGPGESRREVLELGGRTVVRTRHVSPDGRWPVESWRVAGLGHAWSGGSPAGSYADPAGPDATWLIVDFLLTHPRSER